MNTDVLWWQKCVQLSKEEEEKNKGSCKIWCVQDVHMILGY